MAVSMRDFFMLEMRKDIDNKDPWLVPQKLLA